MDDQRPWSVKSRERAINAIISALHDTGGWLMIGGIAPGTNLRPIAEHIYQRAGRDIMEARKAEMGEADRW